MNLVTKTTIVALLAVISAGCKQLKGTTSTKSTQEIYPACDATIADPTATPQATDSIAQEMGLLKLTDSKTASCHLIGETKVAGKTFTAHLNMDERSGFDEIQKKVRSSYAAAVKSGQIKEGYKWISNWWQGVNEICEAALGTSPGASSGYKCIDKKGAIVARMQDVCLQEKWCLPRNFRIVQVTYNKGSVGEHHFLAIFVERPNGLYYLGNIDPWGNPNDPTIMHSGYNILQEGYEDYYQCEPGQIPRCANN